MPVSRVERLRSALRDAVSDILHHQMKDPGIGFVTVTDVEVSGDLRHVKVYVSVMGDAEAQKRTVAALGRATGFVRTEVGRRVRLRHTPEITFVQDRSIEHGSRILHLMNQVRGAGPDGSENPPREGSGE